VTGGNGNESMRSFAEWLVNTPPSIALANSSWVVPAMQTLHIVAIAVLFSSVLMVGLRVMGWAAQSQALKVTVGWYRRWFWGSLAVLAATGAILILIEPPRELLAISFWVKMSALAVAIALAILFLSSVDRHAACWEESPPLRAKALVFVSFGVWCLVVFFGRFIAYDEQIWTTLLALY
jgi:hypothetical protein